MKTTGKWRCLGTAGLGLTLGVLTGCQTWVGTAGTGTPWGGAGVTLPSGRYLDHPPQYIPPSPAFPLPRELATQEGVGAVPPPGAGGIPVAAPPPVGGGGGPGGPGPVP